MIQFTPRTSKDPTRPGMGIGVESTTYSLGPAAESAPIGHADIDFIFAPTYASKRIECRISRRSTLPDTPALFVGPSFGLKLVLLAPNGKIADETEVITHKLTPLIAPDAARSSALVVPNKDPGAPRVVAWNVQFGALLKRPELYRRLLAVIDPDVLLLEEMTSDDSAAALEAFLNRRLSGTGRPWRALFGEGGGPLRCAVASRFPIEPASSLALIPYPDRPDRSLRVLGAVVTIGDRRLLVAALHLKCCGRVDSREDQTRLVEVGLVNRALKATIAAGEFDGVVIGGDLNLVGAYQPIRLLAAGADVDRSDLAILHPHRLDGRSNVTWGNPKERFAPGRLDYLLVSDSSLVESDSFVFHSADFPNDWLARHSLRAIDSTMASDHFPIVADLRWKQ